MKIECETSQIARMLGREIRDTGKSIPHEMQIRELLQNSIEALHRRIKSGVKVDAIPKRAVEIKPVQLNNQKVEKFCTVNYGEDLNRKIIQDHLLNYRNSGNETEGFDKNKGIGWKVVTLPKNSEGVIYYFWEDNVCVYFHMKENDKNEYETVQDTDEEGETHEFFIADEEDVKTIFKKNKMGVAVVLLGNEPKEETYKTMHYSASQTGSNDKSYGRSILKFINSRYYYNAMPTGFTIAAYQQYEKRPQFRSADSTAVKIPQFYSHKSFEFPITFDEINATVEIYARGESCTEGDFSAIETSGYFGIEFKGEVYHNIKTGVRSRKSVNRKCGLTIKPEKFCTILRLTGETCVSVNPERTAINGSNGPLDLEKIYKAICDSRPDDLLEFLDSLVSHNSDDVQKNAVAMLKRLNLRIPKAIPGPDLGTAHPSLGKSKNDDDADGGGFGGDNEGAPKIKKKTKSTTINSRMKSSEPPMISFIDVDDEDRGDTVQFIPNAYTLLIHRNSICIEEILNSSQCDGLEQTTKKQIQLELCNRVVYNCLEWMHGTVVKGKKQKKPSSDIERVLEQNIKHGCDPRHTEVESIVNKLKR